MGQKQERTAAILVTTRWKNGLSKSGLQGGGVAMCPEGRPGAPEGVISHALSDYTEEGMWQ